MDPGAGRWLLQNRYAGRTFFELGNLGEPGRWNTLRALRVLRWWEGHEPPLTHRGESLRADPAGLRYA
jgi:hypothetical protein